MVSIDAGIKAWTPHRGRLAQPRGDPDLHPDLYPKPGRLIEGLLKVGDSCLPGVEGVSGGIPMGFAIIGGIPRGSRVGNRGASGASIVW